MNQLNKIVSFIHWQINASKEQFRCILSDMDKLKVTPLYSNQDLKQYYTHITTSITLLKQVDKSLDSILQTGLLTYNSLKRVYDVYLSRSYFHLKNAYDLFVILKVNPEIASNEICHEIFAKTYSITISYDQMMSSYQTLLRSL